MPVTTFAAPEKHAQVDEEGLLKVLAEDYRVNPGLYMSREDIGEVFDVADGELDRVLVSLEQDGLVKLHRTKRGIQLA